MNSFKTGHRLTLLGACATAIALGACGTSSSGAPQGSIESSSNGSSVAGGGHTSSAPSSMGHGSTGAAGATSNGSGSGSGASTAAGATSESRGNSTPSSAPTTVASKCPGYAAPPAPGTTISLMPTSSMDDEKILPLGCMHLLSNRWTDPMATETLFLNTDNSFGWTWNRGGSGGSNPNYPEVEFGVNPWGETMNGDLTSVSTTDLLPLQFKNMQSASMTVDVDANIATPSLTWNLAFEMWLSPDDPTKGSSTPKFEIMVFLGNLPMYWPPKPMCDASATSYNCGNQLNDGFNNYTLFYASNNWGVSDSGGTPYTYIQYRNSANGGNGQFNGTVNIYKFLQAVNPSGDLYVTRFELGTETYQGAQGNTTIKSLAFEVNGTTEAALMNY